MGGEEKRRIVDEGILANIWQLDCVSYYETR